MATTAATAYRPLTLAIALALAATTAHAATITVTDGGDPDPAGTTSCTLRQAILSANGNTANTGNCAVADISGNVIQFDGALQGATITLGQPDPIGSIRPLIIQGSGQTISGPTGHYALFASSDLSISNLTISGANNAGTGGAIRFQNATLTLADVTLSGNTAALGGGIYAKNSTVNLTNTTISGNTGTSGGGGLSAFNSVVTMTDSTITGNSASSGAGIRAKSGSQITVTGSSINDNTASFAGAGILALDTGTSITLTNTTVSGNTISNYTAGRNGGGLYVGSYAKATLTESTISGNSAFRGGGISARYGADVKLVDSSISNNNPSYSGAGLAASKSTITVINSTLSANVARTGGAIDVLTNSSLTLLDSTVSGNAATQGGAINVNLNSSLSISNSILSGNTGSPTDAYVTSGSTFSAYNSVLGSSTTPDTGTSANNIFSDAPGLAALGNNGGPTQTMALSPTSPAIDAGDNARIAPGVIYDQRGIGNPRITNSTVDIGAFEYRVDVIFADGFDLVP